MKEIKNGIKCEKSKPYQDTLTKIKQTLENDRYRFKLLESSEEPTAYSWLTTTPLIEHAFYLDKTTFWDSIRIRYDIPLKYLPSRCVCRGENSRRTSEISDRINKIADKLC